MSDPTIDNSIKTNLDTLNPQNSNKYGQNLVLLFILCTLGWLLTTTNLPKTGTLSFSAVVESLPNNHYQLREGYLEKMEKRIEAVKKQKPRTLLFEEVTRRKENGGYELSTKRQQKSNDIISKFSSAEQYALKAATSGYFPCSSCPFNDTIFLIIGEVYRYGITVNGAGGRGYSSSYLKNSNLKYFIEYEGDLLSCKIEEIKKIFSYPLLIENLKRNKPLARPPGNPVDN